MAELILSLSKNDYVAVDIIFDMLNFGMKQVHALNTNFAKKMVHFLAVSKKTEFCTKSYLFIFRSAYLSKFIQFTL